ncbi:MAG: hypothetical protein IKY78_06775 [Clostridia bacterium]|nr:hypothetical protein [Clostridia bacterium]
MGKFFLTIKENHKCCMEATTDDLVAMEYPDNIAKKIEKEAASWCLVNEWSWDNGRMGDDWECHSGKDEYDLEAENYIVYKKEFVGYFLGKLSRSVANYSSVEAVGKILFKDSNECVSAFSFFGKNGYDESYCTLKRH